jgi:flagellar biogenesis protein FliO
MWVTINNQGSVWRYWPRWLACLLTVVACESLAESQEPRQANSISHTQQTGTHPLRFFQQDRTANHSHKNGEPETAKSGKQASLATLPIQQPSLNGQSNNRDLADRSAKSTTRAMTTILSALAIVLGVFFLVVWLTRSTNQRRWSPLPKEAVQLLGRAPLAGRQWMQLIRVGNKLVMVSVNGNQVDTITEITDPEEVEQIVALCHKNHSSHFRQTFQQVLDQHRQRSSPDTSLGSTEHDHSYFTSTG